MRKSVVLQTMQVMAKPCFYTAITTIVAFCSLVVSDIRPVIDFGWMMTIGILLAFVSELYLFSGRADFAPTRRKAIASAQMRLGRLPWPLPPLRNITPKPLWAFVSD